MKERRFGRSAVVGIVAGISLVAVSAIGGSSGGAAGGGPLVSGPIQAKARVSPLPTSQCLSQIGIHCYSPYQFESAYRLGGLHAAGIDGSGETIAIVDSFGSPTIASDLHVFDQTFGVSNPYGVPIDPAIAQDPSLTIITPAGTPPAFDPTDSDMVGWAEETTLDVEWAHVIAPEAKILLVETPVSETEGVQGFPEIVTAENYVIDHHLANVISQSFGATEETFPSTASLLALRSAFQNAQRNGVTVLGASGDDGSTDAELNLVDLYPMQVTSWPASDPLVTSIGGTQLNLSDAGNRLSPDVVWNDGFGASGGGKSVIFNRPSFQNGDGSVVGNARGVPDVSMNAAVDGGVWVYYTFITPTSPFHIFGGTSAATPEFSGLVAMADQVAGQSLGTINNELYKIPYGGGLVDVTSGNNDLGSFTNSDGTTQDVPGFDALPGYDLATGLGTIDAARFVPALAAGASGPAGPPRFLFPFAPPWLPGPGGSVSCTGAMTFAAVRSDVHVTRGSSCSITDSTINGNVTVDPGGSLTLQGVTVGNDIHSHGSVVSIGPDSAGSPTIVGHDVEIANGVAGPANVLCGAQIGNNLDVHDNRNETVIGVSGACTTGNSVGNDTNVYNNRVTGGPSAVIAGNTVSHNLLCILNTPAPTGGGNTAAHKTGQCAAF
jgi:hypothetical protein